jgi:TRAP-type C4-dicarboxylate transport system permease large subunit
MVPPHARRVGHSHHRGLRRIRRGLRLQVATAATMGTVALPEMKRYGYADSLATGSVAAGGTLGFLIPPSIGFVVYGMLTEQSIGKLLVAGMHAGHPVLAIWPMPAPSWPW